MGYWLIQNGIPILASPNMLRYATLSEKEIHETHRQQRMIAGEKEETRGRIAGQRGFIDFTTQVAPHEDLQQNIVNVETGGEPELPHDNIPAQDSVYLSLR